MDDILWEIERETTEFEWAHCISVQARIPLRLGTQGESAASSTTSNVEMKSSNSDLKPCDLRETTKVGSGLIYVIDRARMRRNFFSEMEGLTEFTSLFAQIALDK